MNDLTAADVNSYMADAASITVERQDLSPAADCLC